MAKNKGTVFLGFKDEEITQRKLNSFVNKIGGNPDWPVGDLSVASCARCAATRPLIVQLYCPLENSLFHRTLYVFACVNPTCSIQSKNWTCIRVQKIDESYYENEKTLPTRNAQSSQNIVWCSGSDDWEGAVNTDHDFEAGTYFNPSKQIYGNPEENGNSNEKMSNGSEDDDEDSSSIEKEICDFAAMQIDRTDLEKSEAEEDNKNANLGVASAYNEDMGAFGEVKVNATATYAEIEGVETDIVFVEKPIGPEHNLIELLKPKYTEKGLFLNTSDLTLKSFFLAVDEERSYDLSADDPSVNNHIRELYQEYKLNEMTCAKLNSCPTTNGKNIDSDIAREEHETYEKSVPAHGDLMLFNFISILQRNPGQLLRYSRNSVPLLISPISESHPKCDYCNGETICEVQILPTIISILQIKESNVAAPIEFGNVLIYTCLKSCWDTPDKMRYEKVIVQQES